jgi:hypothetical protein
MTDKFPFWLPSFRPEKAALALRFNQGNSYPGAPACSSDFRWVMLILLAVAVAAIVVNPFREFMSQDDGWAYARSVEHLLKTGEYRLDAWSAANMPVQIYLTAALAKLFGYSLSLLRLSTLGLLIAGLLSFHALLLELGVRADISAATTLVLFANPLVLMLSFTFMSDVQFMSWMLIALFLYVRGFRRQSNGLIFCGSLAAGCAIGTRQFGLAIVVGLAISYFVVSASGRPPLRRLLLALLAPAAAAVWQLKSGFANPNLTQVFRLYEQSDFVSQPPTIFLRELAWRVATIWRYIGMAMLAAIPLMIPLAAKLVRTIAPSSGRFSGRVRLTLAIAAIAAASIFLVYYRWSHSSFSARNDTDHFLPLWWMLPNVFWEHRTFMRWFDASGLVGAGLLGWIVIARCATLASVRQIAFEWLLLAAVGVSLLGLHLAYVQLNDTYIVDVLPFALLLVALVSPGAFISRRWVLGSIIVCGAIVLAQSFWLRGDFNAQEAQWRAADELLAEGNAAHCIGASRHWSEYHDAFDDWIAETHPSPSREVSLHAPFFAWLETRSFYALYQISSPWQQVGAAQGWEIKRELPYHSALLQQKTIKVFERIDDHSITTSCARNKAPE